VSPCVCRRVRIRTSYGFDKLSLTNKIFHANPQSFLKIRPFPTYPCYPRAILLGNLEGCHPELVEGKAGNLVGGLRFCTSYGFDKLIQINYYL
jgi:hypothetical protein